MKMREVFALLAAVGVLLAVPAAAAKDFQPGDLRVCGATRCVALTNRDVLQALSTFYYGGTPPRTFAPSVGASMFELKFRNGYVTGIVASADLGHFLSYGVNLGHFVKGTWYAVPARAAAELKRLTRSVRPLRLTAAALRRSH
jgi:hypothetical protein